MFFTSNSLQTMLFSDPDAGQTPHPPPSSKLKTSQWLIISLLALLILAGQTTATLLSRFYYNYGGQSLWMSTIVQSSGAPLLLPFYLLHQPHSTKSLKISSLYIFLGLLIAGDNLMYSYGLLYLPVSTYSLVCATQLAFNAIFSYFLNNQKFTPFILKSSQLRLIMSLMQLSFQKVLRDEGFMVVMHMILWTNFVAVVVSVVGLFVSGEWRGIHVEFVGFEKGRVWYVVALVWIGVGWVVYSVGTVGLIFVASSLFSNVIATLALPLVPVFAVVFFHDGMDGVKVVALLIAVLGFVNYLYQHYLDDLKEEKTRENGDVR